MWKWIKSKLIKTVYVTKEDTRPGFTGLEIITYCRGERVERCLFPVGNTKINHDLIKAVYTDCREDEILTGYIVKLHTFLVDKKGADDVEMDQEEDNRE